MALLLAACGSSLPEPRFTTHPSAAFEEVGFSPPPARVEIVPPSPRSGAVWIDGEWSWDGSRWAWAYGRWVLPPDGASYARWASKRRADGVLLVAPGSWRGPAGAEVPPPGALAVARARGGDVFGVDGEREDTAPNIIPAGAPGVR